MLVCHIYAIHCPISHHIVYIGRSKHPLLRFKKHMRCNSSLIGWWCIAMKKMKFMPYITILYKDFYGSMREANKLENSYIEKYKKLNQANHNRDRADDKYTIHSQSIRLFRDFKKDLISIEIIKSIA